MTELATAHTWHDIRPGIEYSTEPELTGWRVSVALVNGEISPFRDIRGPSPLAEALCHADAEDKHHDGSEVHPGCICGLYLIDTRAHLADYWIDASTRHRKTRDDIGAHRWGGLVICNVDAVGNVTGRATRDGMSPPDTVHTYRTSAMRLRHVLVPTGTSKALADRIARKYPDVSVTQMRGPLHTIRKPDYSWTDR